MKITFYFPKNQNKAESQTIECKEFRMPSKTCEMLIVGECPELEPISLNPE